MTPIFTVRIRRAGGGAESPVFSEKREKVRSGDDCCDLRRAGYFLLFESILLTSYDKYIIKIDI